MNIKELLPHRDPFLFIDSVDKLFENKIIATKSLTGNEELFKGHFPNSPITPGVIMVEGLLQTGALFMTAKMPSNAGPTKIPVVTRIKDVKFKNMAIPPIILNYDVELIETMGDVSFFKGKVLANDKTLVTAEFACALVDGK